jgi:hypothetical protein
VKPGWKSTSQICVQPWRHAVADRQAAHLRADRRDDPGQLVAGHVGERDRRIVAHPAVPVAAADAGRLDRDDHAVGGR